MTNIRGEEKEKKGSLTSLTLTARNECLGVDNMQQFRQLILFKFLSWNLIDPSKLTVFALGQKVKQKIKTEFYPNKFRTDGGLLRCQSMRSMSWPRSLSHSGQTQLSSVLQITFHSSSSPFLFLISVISYKNGEVLCHRRIAIFSRITKKLRLLLGETWIGRKKRGLRGMAGKCPFSLQI